MKYSKSNPPLVCIMNNSTCYKGTSTMSVKGILWHSTGANNPNLKRYVQPSENDPNYHTLLGKLGKNPYGNDWNHETIQAGMNAWIGKLADGTVTSIQTLPWNYKPWGCGSGALGSCNDGWIQFEICEDNLNDKNYFNQVYKEACELTAYLCALYNLNPQSSIMYKNVNIPVILCHRDSYLLKMGTGHADVYHWFNKYGKTMDDVRNDVAKLMNKPVSNQSTILVAALGKGDVGDQVKTLQENLIKLGFSCGPDGADGDFGTNTYNAVIKFQQTYNLGVDGLVGPETQNKIKELLQLNNKPQSTIYRVRKSWSDAKSQIGAYGNIHNAKAACDRAGSGYSVFNNTGAAVYSANSNRVEITSNVLIGHSSKDENNSYRGGQAGDQTLQEVCVRNWYRGNWNVVLRPIDSKIAEKIALNMEAACANDNIGYDQQERNTIYEAAKKVNFDISKINSPCECDCSSLVSVCCILAGLPESAFYVGRNMMTTYTLKKACLSTEQFKALETSKYYAQQDYLKRGDILLYENGHTAIVLSNGKNAESNIEDFNQYLVRITSNVLNVNSGPGDSYSTRTTIKKGQVFTIVDQEGGWGKLKSGAGWINLTYTSKL